MLHHLKIKDYLTTTRYSTDISLSYELFGQPLHTAPIVLINHALTGNSNVAGTKGWWQDLVGAGKPLIPTNSQSSVLISLVMVIMISLLIIHKPSLLKMWLSYSF